MTNEEIFRQYSTERWVITQNLCFLLQEYWEKHGKKAVEDAKNGYITSDMPCNPVSFVREFMKDETLCNVGYAEKSKISTVEDNAIEDVDFVELA